MPWAEVEMTRNRSGRKGDNTSMCRSQ
jgi:hypothetical protein